MNTTCKKEEYLEIDEKILILSKRILTKKQIDECEELSKLICTKEKKIAINKLRILIGRRPKRPLYYLDHELQFLPRWTRNSIKFLGDYLDNLIKYVALEYLGLKAKPLGVNLSSLKNKLPAKLHNELTEYNELIYVPAKHDFNVKNRRHRFTSKEVVYTAYITIVLAEQIKEISKSALLYSQDDEILEEAA